ncbi:cell surface protein SprA [Parasediminibacterium sp. JCM 36343]|uniref:T9SS outer membrane translocon Sov/SprA n=1 Tax=Parasediminibacterium sp. JCM 36343 TaxID=3374279 RepID=UPI0039786F73
MNQFIRSLFFFLSLVPACCLSSSTAMAQGKDTTAKKAKDTTLANAKDTAIKPFIDSSRFPLGDRRGDRFTYRNKNSFDVNDTALINQNIEYDPKTNQYYITEKVGGNIYRKATYLTFEEFYALQNRLNEAAYFKQRSDALAMLNRKVKRPNHNVVSSLYDRIFGASDSASNNPINNIKKQATGLKNKVNGLKDSAANAPANIAEQLKNALKIDIKPQGSIDILAGYQGQKTLNPTLPESARKNGGFDFNMNTNFNMNASIGNKLKLPISYNTLANFDYLNQLKLDYKGKDDEIIKTIEAGNMSWQSKGTLIPSFQNLFGLKTKLQFGKFYFTAAIANQKSQRQTQTLKGGAASTTFQKKLDDYEENRHFLLAQYFRDNYNTTMAKLPVVSSQVQIQRIEVWITNKTGATTDARYVVGLADLGEKNPYNPSNAGGSPSAGGYPDNGANGLYSKVTAGGLQSDFRSPSKVSQQLTGINLKPVNDYEITFARKLAPSEYYFNPQVGFISINSQLQSDDVLGVAYQYTSNGRVYQVGEFSQDIALDTTTQNAGVQKVLFLKLLKATSARTQLPIWNLMMKNVYSLDLAGLSREDFKLNVLYDDPSGGLKRYLPESSPATSGKSLLNVLNLDRLNNRNDPQPDGVFDYIEGFTVLSQQGKIIFPVLQPFGNDLQTLAFTGVSPIITNKYIFHQLYDSIKAIAQTYPNLDRFLMQGQAKGTGGSEIYLGAFNIPQGSVKVTGGGQVLIEGVDYTIDYNLGSVKILNQAILNSGVPVNVSYENNGNFGIQQRGFLGLRADYIANKKLSLGASLVRLKERPFFTKMDYGDDPINNTMYGFDISYRSEMPSITRLLNRLPFYKTKAPSSITAYGEAAYLKPGHASQIGSGDNGLIYIDDFEGSSSTLDLRFPLISWALASTPQRFPEAQLNDSLPYGQNRAKLAWYNIEPNLQDKNSSTNPLKSNLKALSDPRTRLVYTNELFPQQTTNITNTQTTTFDLAYYPKDLGPYNYESDPGQIDANGKLKNPASRWGGIMRALDQTDFETNNFQYIEFWVQDPFIKNPSNSTGQLVFNLGSVSEDILKDGQRFYENGLNTPTSPAAVDSISSVWGKVPVNPIQVTQAFSNDPNDRPYQDVGFDGLDDAGERSKRKKYLDTIKNNFGETSTFYKNAFNDPSHDDYVWYRDASYDAAGTDILGRYKNYNNPQGNSPIASSSSQFSSAATLYPDNEDLNKDNTLNQTEEYFEYTVNLSSNMAVGTTKYVTDSRPVQVTYADGGTGTENWYLFRVPIKDYTGKVGQIPDFKSIRFMRMYMTGFADSAVLRFAKLGLVRNQWRQYNYTLDTNGVYTPLDSIGTTNTTTFNTLSVNLEENSSRKPVNYVIPPGIDRVQQLSNNGINLLQNEQAMSMQVYGLKDGQARATFKTLNLDIRSYGKLSMFAHAESVLGQTALKDSDLNLVVRIGQDFSSNFYEVKIPLKITPAGSYSSASSNIVWPAANNLDFKLQDLINLKLKRNNTNGTSFSTIYREQLPGDNKTYSVLGNPNLGQVQGILVGVENAAGGTTSDLSTEVWINELRLSQIQEQSSHAAIGRVDVQLADLGRLSVSASNYSVGWGTIEQKVNDRAKNSLTTFDAALTIDAGKLLPKEARISLPVYAGYNNSISTPQYDPYDQDVLYSYKLNAAKNKAARDSIKRASVDQTIVKTLNFTNVRILPKGKPHLWSISNFDASFSYTKTTQTSPTILGNDVTKYKVNAGYVFNSPSKYIEPFKKIIKSRSPWLAVFKDINFNLRPSLVSVRTDINRQFGRYIPRIVNTDEVASKVERVDTTYDKYFTFDRFYNLRWDLTRSVNADFSATNNARVDEPDGALNTKAKKDTLWKNFFDGGRNTYYFQKTTLGYTVPLNKIPALDWLTARYSYGTSYDWIAASQVADKLGISLGNIIENSQDNTFNGEIDFTRLYSKFRWLRAIDNSSRGGNRAGSPLKPDLKKTGLLKDKKGNPAPAVEDKQPKPNALGIVIATKDEVLMGKDGKQLTGKKRTEALLKWRKQKRDLRIAERLQRNNKPVELNGFEKTVGRFLTMVKRVSINYNENYKSRVPGYLESTRILGQNWKTMQPGMDYVFGKQPNQAWLDRKGRQGVLSRDSNFNNLYRQNFEQKLSITAQIEPIRDLLIDLNIDKTFSKEYTELFKDTTYSNSPQQHLSPYASGGFNISYIAFGTMFGNTNPNEVSATFRRFEANRAIISDRAARANPYWVNSGSKKVDGYSDGYGRYSQDVLIPAFLAAYTKQDPNKIALINQSNKTIKTNPFAGIIPRPNWRLTYTGLSKVPVLAKIFNAITFTHGYTGNLSMNSYTSALNFTDPTPYGQPSFYDTISHNYVPFYLLPNVTIQENFGPLIGFDITTNKQVNIKFEYKKSRTLSLSLIDYQLSETNSTEIVLGAGYRVKGFKLPFSLPGMLGKKKLDNDMSFRLDIAKRNDATSNSRLDQANAYGTGGQKVLTIQPSIDYVLNKRVNIKLFFDQRRVTPYISTSAPTISTRAGLQIRVSLAP